MIRTHYNGTLRKSDANTEVKLVGWVNRRRNLGAIVFIDLRDASGIVQLVFNEEISEEVKDVRNEYVLEVEGVVQERKDINPNMPTGDIEVIVKKVNILNSSDTPPINLSDDTDTSEEVIGEQKESTLKNKKQEKVIIKHMKSNLVIILNGPQMKKCKKNWISC